MIALGDIDAVAGEGLDAPSFSTHAGVVFMPGARTISCIALTIVSSIRLSAKFWTKRPSIYTTSKGRSRN